MTTEPRRPATAAPRPATPGLHLYITALLALAYSGAWWVFGLRTSTAEALPPPPPSATAGEAGPTIWYGDLPPSRRPAVSLPPGWQIIPLDGRTPPSTVREAPIPVRYVPTRAGRVRTRSS